MLNRRLLRDDLIKLKDENNHTANHTKILDEKSYCQGSVDILNLVIVRLNGGYYDNIIRDVAK